MKKNAAVRPVQRHDSLRSPSTAMNVLQQNFRVHGCTLRHFCNLSPSRLRTVLTWRNDPRIAAYMFNQNTIPYAEHLSFCKRLRHDCCNAYWMVLRGSRAIGVVDLKAIDWERARAFLGMYANPNLIGSGVGGLLLRCVEYVAFTHLGLRELFLQVRPENSRARALYRKHGYVEVQPSHDSSSCERSAAAITMRKPAPHHPDE